MARLLHRRPTPAVWSCAIVAAALALAGCGGSSSKSGKTDNGGAVTSAPAPGPTPTPTPSGASGAARPAVRVEISSFKFKPEAITVKVGGKVTWTNHDPAPHTATSSPDNSLFNTDTLRRGQSKAVTFSKAGTYQYTCLFHAFMTGTVVVK